LITFWIIISIILCVGYACLQFFYVYQWKQIDVDLATTIHKELSVALIIPTRNEANNIESLLHSIAKQNYPSSQIEIIIVDDFSEDDTVEKAKNILQQLPYQYKILHLKNYITNHLAHKKSAIEYAIAQTNQELIITTDADCVVQPYWIKNIVQMFVATNANLVASPVALQAKSISNIWNRFECLDFCGMQLITGASIQAKIFNMANGANLAYLKSAFLACDGYKGIDNNASGDDMLLIHKIAQLDKEKIFFLKNGDVITYTSTTNSIKEFLHQRFRWTSKATLYQDKRITIMLALVLLFCISILVNLLLTLAFPIYYSIFPNHSLDGLLCFLNVLIFAVLFIFQFIFKTIADYYLLKQATRFFNAPILMNKFIVSECLHIAYIVFVGTLGSFVSSNWKGRKIK